MRSRSTKTIALLFFAASVLACGSTAISKNTTEMTASCVGQGWVESSFAVGAQKRRLLYKLPQGAWQGAILVLHGGGGQPEHFCDDSIRLIRPQVRFAQMALKQNFAVFALDSSAVVTDTEGLVCGKIWDDEVRSRPNLDLPYLKHIISTLVPGLRKSTDNSAIFMTGLSSGGYMTVRAATHLGDKLKAFAPISSGDPYGWRRRCDPKYGNSRENVKGAGFDNETGKEIIEKDSCLSARYPNEKKWEDFGSSAKPKFRIFHSDKDGVNDYSCGLKVEKQLKAHGFSGEPAYILKQDGGRRRLINHFWQDEYNPELLEFFKRQMK